MGYYDPYPALYLDRPKVLVGPLGGGVALTGASASAMLGLPFTDLDRLVEHSFGCDFAAAVRKHGWKRWHEKEYELLKRSIGQSPAGIIALGEGSLEDSRVRALVLSQGDGWYLARNVFDTFGRLQTVWDTHRQRYPLFHEFPTMQDLQRLNTQRLDNYREMPNAEDVSGLHPHVVARRLVTAWGLHP
ncbi:MAG: shikimate kinase [Myxococcota bacterium]|nr:shikimate kinase [Myxococcota bacterium]